MIHYLTKWNENKQNIFCIRAQSVKPKENALTLGVKKTRAFSTVVEKNRISLFQVAGKTTTNREFLIDLLWLEFSISHEFSAIIHRQTFLLTQLSSLNVRLRCYRNYSICIEFRVHSSPGVDLSMNRTVNRIFNNHYRAKGILIKVIKQLWINSIRH